MYPILFGPSSPAIGGTPPPSTDCAESWTRAPSRYVAAINGLCKSLGAISLFDFGPTAVDIKSGGHWTQWCGSEQASLPRLEGIPQKQVGIWLRVRDDYADDRLIDAGALREIWKTNMRNVVPGVEGGHRGPLAIAELDQLVVIQARYLAAFRVWDATPSAAVLDGVSAYIQDLPEEPLSPFELIGVRVRRPARPPPVRKCAHSALNDESRAARSTITSVKRHSTLIRRSRMGVCLDHHPLKRMSGGADSARTGAASLPVQKTCLVSEAPERTVHKTTVFLTCPRTPLESQASAPVGRPWQVPSGSHNPTRVCHDPNTDRDAAAPV